MEKRSAMIIAGGAGGCHCPPDWSRHPCAPETAKATRNPAQMIQPASGAFRTGR